MNRKLFWICLVVLAGTLQRAHAQANNESIIWNEIVLQAVKAQYQAGKIRNLEKLRSELEQNPKLNTWLQQATRSIENRIDAFAKLHNSTPVNIVKVDVSPAEFAIFPAPQLLTGAPVSPSSISEAADTRSWAPAFKTYDQTIEKAFAEQQEFIRAHSLMEELQNRSNRPAVNAKQKENEKLAERVITIVEGYGDLSQEISRLGVNEEFNKIYDRLIKWSEIADSYDDPDLPFSQTHKDSIVWYTGARALLSYLIESKRLYLNTRIDTIVRNIYYKALLELNDINRRFHWGESATGGSLMQYNTKATLLTTAVGLYSILQSNTMFTQSIYIQAQNSYIIYQKATAKF